MKVFTYSPPHCAIFELKEGSSEPELVAEEIRTPEDGLLLASAPQLLETARIAEKAFVWMMSNCNLKVLPTELQPLKLHLLKAQQAIAQSGQ